MSSYKGIDFRAGQAGARWAARLQRGMQLLAAALPLLLAQGVLVSAASPVNATEKYGQEFKGKIGRSYAESKEWWPAKAAPKPGTPNVLAIMLDDVGFAHLSSYGGLVDTPNIDRLAKNGLRYNNFTTTALCSPSRASFMAGRDHHRAGLGSHSVTAMGFPGYNAMTPASVKSFSKNLQKAGFVNYAIGKWDHMPLHHVTETGPFDHWPSGEGFDHFYGFMAAETDNFRPLLWRDHHPVEDWQGKPDYIYGEAMADEAIRNITSHVSIAPDRPFMMYLATAEMHAPHHAPAAWLQRYRGKFDMGWDKAREMILARQIALGVVPKGTRLNPRSPGIAAWDTLPEQEKRLYARQMEAAAAALSHSDAQIGRIIDTLERTGQLANTLIIVVSDNGASAEGGLTGTHTGMAGKGGAHPTVEQNLKYYERWGGPETTPHFHAGWAMAGNTPFRYFKQMSHRGGVSTPMIVHWPKGIKARGEVRSQFHHITDVAPTVLEASGVPFATEIDGVRQLPLDGVSMAYSFDNKEAKSGRTEQYYELFGNRGIRRDGWTAVTVHGDRMPWKFNSKVPFDADRWELYHTEQDFSESEDLAARHPEKLEELKAAWDKLAWRNNVYPLHDDMMQRWNKLKFQAVGQRREFTYYPPGAVRISESAAAPVRDMSHSIETTFDLQGGEEGTIVASGGVSGGYALFVKDGRAWYEYNHKGDTVYTLQSALLPKGKLALKFDFIRTGPHQGIGALYVNGAKVDEIRIAKMHALTFALTETFDVGIDTGTPVSTRYGTVPHFPYAGKLERVVVRLSDAPPAAPD